MARRKRDDPIWKDVNKFEEGQKVPMKIHGIIYIPGKIVTGICYHNDYPDIKIDNEFPHITLFT